MHDVRQIRKLLKIKTMRRKMAELEVARANAEVARGLSAVEQAQQEEADTLASGAERREKRISRLLDEPGNVSMQNAMIVNVFARTRHEKARARAAVLQKSAELLEARNLAIEKQRKLARFLQVEERAKQFCDRLETSERLEAQRAE
ncbi:MAG: hypothetical protein AAFN43_01470 [Pseudomonadota bacterium]